MLDDRAHESAVLRGQHIPDLMELGEAGCDPRRLHFDGIEVGELAPGCGELAPAGALVLPLRRIRNKTNVSAIPTW